MKPLHVLAVTALVAGSVLALSGSGSAAREAELPPAAVDDYTYPDAEQVFAEHGLRVFRGDGHIVLAGSRTYDEGQCQPGQIQVEKSLEAEPYGIYYCFRTWGVRGFLALEVPSTFGIRGGDKPVQAKANLPGGEQRTYAVPANGYVAIEPGTGPELPQAILVELRISPPAA